MIKLIISVVMMIAVSVSVFGAGAPEEVEDYPSQEIRVIVPFGAGGGTDTHARLLQTGLNEVLPVPVVIDNIAGGAGAVGATEVLQADPDGYTVLINIVNIWTQKALGNTDYGPLDLEPVAEAGRYALVETTGTGSRFNSFEEIIAAIREQPGSVEVATNIGAITHFTSLGVQEELGGGAEFDLVHIGDGAQRISDVLGGHVDLTIMGVQEALPYYEAGEMKVLGVYADQRLDVMPDVPTMREQGLDYVQEVAYWFFMPPGTPQEAVDYFAEAIEQVMQMDHIVQELERQGLQPTFLRGDELVRAIERDGERIMNLAEIYDLAE